MPFRCWIDWDDGDEPEELDFPAFDERWRFCDGVRTCLERVSTASKVRIWSNEQEWERYQESLAEDRSIEGDTWEGPGVDQFTNLGNEP